MTTYLGSVKKMPGHILVSTENLYLRTEESWSIYSTRIKVGLQPIPYRFLLHKGRIYYVNGRKQVYETDIVASFRVFFNPVGYQILNDRSCHPIQFKLLSKVEWVFL